MKTLLLGLVLLLTSSTYGIEYEDMRILLKAKTVLTIDTCKASKLVSVSNIAIPDDVYELVSRYNNITCEEINITNPADIYADAIRVQGISPRVDGIANTVTFTVVADLYGEYARLYIGDHATSVEQLITKVYYFENLNSDNKNKIVNLISDVDDIHTALLVVELLVNKSERVILTDLVKDLVLVH